MNLYIFSDIGKVSDCYHSEGGLAIIAKDKREIKNLIQRTDVKITEEEMKTAKVFVLSKNYKSKVFVFPDSGCC